MTYVPAGFLESQEIQAGVALPLSTVTLLIAESGPAALFAAAGATGWTIGSAIGENIEGFTSTIAGGLVQLGVPPDVLYEPGYGNPDDWVYTIPDPTKPLPMPFYKSPIGNRFPNNNPNIPDWMKAIVYGTGAAQLTQQFMKDAKINPETGSFIDRARRNWNQIKSDVGKGYQDFQNWHR